jgi:signal transduction histidine kinase
MPSAATGVAFVDRSGTLVAADRGFLGALGVVDGADATAALRARAEASPALRAFLSGDGPPVASLDGPGGPVELSRTLADGGALLVARPQADAERLEHAARSLALTRVAAGVAHDIKNPLNAMALQIALLSEKLASVGDAAAAAAAHLGPLRDQIGRVNEVVRRLLDVADPSAPLGFTDLGGLTADAAALLGHDARRRRVEIALDAPAGVKTRCEPARVGRLVLALVHRALAGTPEGGRLAIRVEGDGEEARVVLEHAGADRGAALGYDSEVASEGARALGGRLEVERGVDGERVVLALPRNRRE